MSQTLTLERQVVEVFGKSRSTLSAAAGGGVGRIAAETVISNQLCPDDGPTE